MSYYFWLGLAAEFEHLGMPEHEDNRRDALIALGYLKN